MNDQQIKAAKKSMKLLIIAMMILIFIALLLMILPPSIYSIMLITIPLFAVSILLLVLAWRASPPTR